MSERQTWPPGLRGDLARLFSSQGTHEGKPSLTGALVRAVTRPGPLAILLYRLGHRLWERGFHTLAEVLWRLNFFLSGADIHPGAKIGGGLRLTHTAGLVVGKGAVIGSDVTLLHGVTLGGSSRGFFDPEFTDGFPTIGDGSKIAAGAKLLGPITIGKGCFIGANAVVAKDLPDGTIYTPGRKVSELSKRIDELEAELADLRRAVAESEAAR
ncbi:MAG TPA: serine O-acetyltransferase [Actinomycetota bacterium]|nr:serine O-acetyltransferase [Actinomycetota bacterium]